MKEKKQSKKNVLKFKEGMVGVETPPTHVCPVCKTTASIPALNISIAGYEGDYCMTCWAKHIAENVPKLEEITEREGN